MAVSTAPSRKKKCKECGRRTEHRTVKCGKDRRGEQRYNERCVPCHNDRERDKAAERMRANRAVDPFYGHRDREPKKPTRKKGKR